MTKKTKTSGTKTRDLMREFWDRGLATVAQTVLEQPPIVEVKPGALGVARERFSAALASMVDAASPSEKPFALRGLEIFRDRAAEAGSILDDAAIGLAVRHRSLATTALCALLDIVAEK